MNDGEAIRERIKSLDHHSLLRMLDEPSSTYTPEAWATACEELIRRGGREAVLNQIREEEELTRGEEERRELEELKAKRLWFTTGPVAKFIPRAVLRALFWGMGAALVIYLACLIIGVLFSSTVGFGGIAQFVSKGAGGVAIIFGLMFAGVAINLLFGDVMRYRPSCSLRSVRISAAVAVFVVSILCMVGLFGLLFLKGRPLNSGVFLSGAPLGGFVVIIVMFFAVFGLRAAGGQQSETQSEEPHDAE